jgi:hypothetical protein
VIIYPGSASKRSEVREHFGHIVDYLVNSRQIDQGRIRTIEGKKRDHLFVELWIIPLGATPPNP